MARCLDKRFKLAGLDIPTGSACTVDGAELTVVSGRHKPGDGEIHAKELIGRITAGADVRIALPVDTAVVDGQLRETTIELPVTSEMLAGLTEDAAKRGVVGQGHGGDRLDATLSVIAAAHGANAAAAVAADQLQALHLKSTRGASASRARGRLAVLEEYLPGGYVAAMSQVPGPAEHLARIQRTPADMSLHKQLRGVTAERREAVRVMARASGWRAAGVHDPLATLASPAARDALPPAVWMGVYHSATERPVVNLTPHEVTLCTETGLAQRTYPSSGNARASQTREALGTLTARIDPVAARPTAYGTGEVPVVSDTFGGPTGIPDAAYDPDDTTVFIVSKLTADALLAEGRIDPAKLVLTSALVKNPDGSIAGTERFANAPAQRTQVVAESGTALPSGPVTIENYTDRDIIIAPDRERLAGVEAELQEALATHRKAVAERERAGTQFHSAADHLVENTAAHQAAGVDHSRSADEIEQLEQFMLRNAALRERDATAADAELAGLDTETRTALMTLGSLHDEYTARVDDAGAARKALEAVCTAAGATWLPQAGPPALAEERFEPTGVLHGRPIGDMVYGTTGLASPTEGTVKVVSIITAGAALTTDPGRDDLMVTTDLIRDSEGRPFTVGALARP